MTENRQPTAEELNGVKQDTVQWPAKAHRVTQVNSDGNENSAQHPTSADGDSVYQKDIWVEESTVTGWEDTDSIGLPIVTIPFFPSSYPRITNSTTDNPKILLIHFNRTVSAYQVGLGCYQGTDSFSNVKVELLGSSGEIRTVVDESGDNTKYNSRNYEFEPQLFNAVKLEFHTADEICISNITIQKARLVEAYLKAQRPDDVIANIQATNGGNLKISLEELENDVKGIQPQADSLAVTVATDHYDETTRAVNIIDYEHHEIHSGSHFNYADYETEVANGTTIDFTFTTPDTAEWTHLTFKAYSSLGMTVELYEGATGVTGGTPITPRNNNRNSANTSGITLLKDPTITSDGTRAAGFLAGADRIAGNAERENEFVLKQNTTYITRITSLANGNAISWDAEWYEHTNSSNT